MAFGRTRTRFGAFDDVIGVRLRSAQLRLTANLMLWGILPEEHPLYSENPKLDKAYRLFQRSKLILKIYLAMMDFLLGDVRKNRFPGRLADRKNTVAALPAESVMALAFYDSGRAGFEILDQLGEGDLSGESAKNMDMIFHTADLKRVALQAAYQQLLETRVVVP